MELEDEFREVLSSRTLGEVVPVSIATALALESLLGENPEAPVKDHHLDQFDSLYINVRTLARNLLGAIEGGHKDTHLSPEIVLEYILAEMNVIHHLMLEEAEGKNVIFYTSSYKEVYQKSFKHGIVKEYKTPRQAYQYARESYVSERIKVALEESQYNDLTLIEVDTKIPDDKVDVVILTHYAVDLLSRYNFRSLDLIESHTGALKGPSEWYTKLTGHKDRPPIPFDRAMLQVFGDGTMFLSSKRKLRQAFIELSEKYKWTYRTTEEKVKYTAGKLRDPAFDLYVKELYIK